jgi:hypothetical protein
VNLIKVDRDEIRTTRELEGTGGATLAARFLLDGSIQAEIALRPLKRRSPLALVVSDLGPPSSFGKSAEILDVLSITSVGRPPDEMTSRAHAHDVTAVALFRAKDRDAFRDQRLRLALELIRTIATASQNGG